MKLKVLILLIQNQPVKPGVFQKYVLIVICFSSFHFNQSQNIDNSIYDSKQNLSVNFLNKLCTSIRIKEETIQQQTEFERLLNIAAQTSHLDSLQPVMIRNWFLKNRKQCECPAAKKLESGHLIEWIIAVDFRDAANLIGPNGRLNLALETPYSNSEITALQYTRNQLDLIETKFNHDRLKFQKNKDWKRFIFYFMLFTEYKVQYEVKMEELK